jgi:glyoxylase-like metal-dependent hydrolase (beta-lactamase superfamily II)
MNQDTDNAITLLFTGAPATADGFEVGASTVALCRHNGRRILFDTGPYPYRPMLLGRLQRLGLTPADIDTVVLSHLHWDTATNADLFRNADILVHARELAYAETPAAHATGTQPYLARALNRLRIRPVSGESELAPGLRVVELPGHTPGSIGLLVGDELLAGDAVAGARAAATGEPDLPAADFIQARSSIARALTLAPTIYPGHDRPFRLGPPIAYVGDYQLRIRLFFDPVAMDQEICIKAEAPRSFATWP